MLTSLLLSTVLAADCDRGWSRKALLGSVGRVEKAHRALDLEGLHKAADEVRVRIPCVGEALLPEDAARIHRAEGLSRFSGGDHEGAAMAFAASRTLEPDWVFPDHQVPEGHPLRQVYTALSTAGAGYAGVPQPQVGRVLVNGAERRGRPLDWPALVQVVGDQGVLLGAYLWPQDPFPQIHIEAVPLPLFASEGFVPPTREEKPSNAPEALSHRRSEVRYDAVAALEDEQEATEPILWALFTDPADEVRLKAWRVLRARARRGHGDQARQVEAVGWLAEHGDGMIQEEAVALLPSLQVD